MGVVSSGCGGEKKPDKTVEQAERILSEPKPTEPVLKWEYRVGRKLPENLYVDSKTNEVLLADSIGNIIALSFEDGAPRTVIHTPGPIMGWEMVSWDDRIVSSSVDKHVRLNDITTGEELWSVDCETTPSEPLVTSTGVLVSDGTGPYRCRYLAMANGGAIWQREFDAKPGNWGANGFYDPKLVIIGFEDRYIRALSFDNGQTMWEFQVGEPLEINKEGLWKGKYDFLGIEGDEIARGKPFQIGGIGKPFVDVGILVPSEDGYVRCFDTNTGDLMWEHKFDDRVWHIRPGPENKRHSVYVETIEGDFYRMDSSMGTIYSSVKLVDPSFGFIDIWPQSALIVDGSGTSSEMLMRDNTDFSVIRKLNFGMTLIGGFITEDRSPDLLIARTDDGRIVCFQMPGY